MGPENTRYEDESTNILDTIPVLFRDANQILYAIDFLRETDLTKQIQMVTLNKGKLLTDQYIYLNRIIDIGKQKIAISALIDALDGLNMLK